MADINRFQNLPEYTHFEPAVVDTASMYAKMREAGINNLQAKKQLTDQTKDTLDKVNQELYKFTPSESFLTLNTNSDVIQNPNRLYHEEFVPLVNNYNTALTEYYDKHKGNLSTLEAQDDYRKLQNLGSSTINRLSEVKRSDDARQKSDDSLLKWKSDTPLGDINGNVWSHNKDMLNSFSVGSKSPLLTTPIQPNKAINIEESINKYIGDNGIQIIKDARLSQPEIDAAGGLIPYLKSGKVTQETRQRLSPILDKFYNNWETVNKPLLENEALQRIYDNSLIGGDQSKNDFNNHLQNVRSQYKNRFNEFAINDSKTDRDLDYKLLSDDQAKGSGKGIYNPTRDISIIENPLMDSNVKPEVFDLDDKGNLKTQYTTTEMRTVKDEFGVRDKVPTKITRTLTASTPQEYSKLLYDNEAFRNVLNAEGVNIVGDVKAGDIPKIQKALKDNKDRVYNNLQLATNGYKAVQLNVPKLDQTMTNQINATTLRFNKDQTLPKDLPQKDTKTGSMDGSTFNDWLSNKYNVKIQTDNILAATGQLGKPVGLKRTVLYQDEKGGTTKRLDIYQDSPFKDINDNPDYNALNEITKYTSSGKDASQVKVPTNKGEYIFELKRTPNNQNKTYDYTGKVYDPITKTWSTYEDFKKASTVGILLDVLKNSEGVGRSFTKDDIGQVEALYNQQNENITSEEK